jgi:hypothetical protein
VEVRRSHQAVAYKKRCAREFGKPQWLPVQITYRAVAGGSS